MYFFIHQRAATEEQPENDGNFSKKLCTDTCLNRIADGVLQCKCGEGVNRFEWKFKKDEEDSLDIVLTNDDRDVMFHPTYSQGTALLRGDRPFEKNKHYYWEVKMTSNLYGTDVMVGIGTGKMQASDWRFRFCSILGLDGESWGYSYNGCIQHNQLGRKYGRKFGIGSLVGVHLDMWRGTLEYYVNRRPQGIAFNNVKRPKVYPMLSSTAAKSALRVTCATSMETSLQLYCLKVVMKSPQIYKIYREELPQIARIYDQKYFWLRPSAEVMLQLMISQKKRERKNSCQDSSNDEKSTCELLYGDLDKETSTENTDRMKKIKRDIDSTDECIFAII